MAKINAEGNIQANCPGCNGALASFEWRSSVHGPFGAVAAMERDRMLVERNIDYRLFRCAGCGRGGLGTVVYGIGTYPGPNRELRSFTPEVHVRLPIPKSVPTGITSEYREGEHCMDANCFRAAAGMFRSVLEKTLRANGYKEKKGTTLEQQIDTAADDGVITHARKKRAHDEIRVLGNDVLHDEWQPIVLEDVEAARHFAQRILEDLYDDRPSVLVLLRGAGRAPDDDKEAAEVRA